MSQENKDIPKAAEEDRDGIADKESSETEQSEDQSPGIKEKQQPENDAEGETIAESSKDDTEEAEAESERYLRLAAEFDNYKKRTAREFGEVIRTANLRLLLSLVELADNFERALGHEVDNDDAEAYRKGVELIYNQLADLLVKERVTAIESVGQQFDPNYHEAMMQSESDEYDEGIVCREIQKGYKIDNKVLRHARVVVSNGKPEAVDENK